MATQAVIVDTRQRAISIDCWVLTVDTPCVPYLPPILIELHNITQDQRTTLGQLRIERRRQRHYKRWYGGGDGQVPGDVGRDSAPLGAKQGESEKQDDMVDLERGRREAPLLAQLAAFRAVPYNIQRFGLTAQLAPMRGPALEIWSEEELQQAYAEDVRRRRG